MAQGDIVVIIDKLTKELDNLSSLNSSVKISQFEQGLIVDKILKSHEKALESRKEAYRYDLTQDTISSYLKKIHKHSKKYFEEKENGGC